MRSWNSPGSHSFGCQDVSGILGSFLDIFLLGIIIGMEHELNPQYQCFLLVQVLFELRGGHKYCGFSNSFLVVARLQNLDRFWNAALMPAHVFFRAISVF